MINKGLENALSSIFGNVVPSWIKIAEGCIPAFQAIP